MRRALLALIIACGAMLPGLVAAQTAGPNPDDLRTLAELLRKPDIQAWLEAQAAPPPPEAASDVPQVGTQATLAENLQEARGFVRELAAAIPTVPGQLQQAWGRVAGEIQERGPFSIVLLLVIFAGLGFGLEWLFMRATTSIRQTVIAAGVATVEQRLRAVWMRTVYGLGMVVAFALGSIGAFLLFDWPPLLKQIVLAYLSLVLIVRVVLVLGRILLAPAVERFRIVPMATPAARFWFVWSAVLIGYFFFVQFSLDLLAMLGVSQPARFASGMAAGIVLLGMALWIVWRHPDRVTGMPHAGGARLGSWLLSAYLVLVWLLLFTGSATPFYVGVVLLLLPIAITNSRHAVNHLLRPNAEEAPPETTNSLLAVLLERGLRALLLIGGAFLIADILGLDLGELTTRDTLATRLLRGAINAVIIAMLADLAWCTARVWIDRTLAEAVAAGPSEGPEARKRARLRTLLPILRNILFVLVLVTAGLMVLSSLGVQIGPLLAGAGVVGVAIGFGAQTLVKDIISGMFFLLDDAFRVGEYIESGSIRGTVESFSLRSIKLRHHRGYLHTVPFGSLDKITNYSRDWVIDKMTIGVTYDTDLDLVKRIIKQVGRQLLADETLKPHIMETLKMQGVETYEDYAIRLRLKMMTKPGEQFVIRRRAYALIKQAFATNGIKFASPTVQVAGGEGTAAAAQVGMDVARAASAPTPAA